MTQRFSPLLVSNLLIHPMRYFFSFYAGDDFKYDNEDKKTKIEIGAFNDLHRVPIQQKPRILVNRGNYTITGSGLSDNLAQGKTVLETKGLRDHANMVFINGMATIVIEAKNEGSVETLADMVSHFFVWSRPFIMNTQGFKNFAMPLAVTAPTLDKEDKEKFQVTISIPYTAEEQWHVNSDALKLNNFYLSLVSS